MNTAASKARSVDPPRTDPHDVPVRDRLTSWVSNPATFWKLNLVIWSVFGVFGFLIRYAAITDAQRAFCLTLLQEPLAFLISGGLYLVYRRPSLSDPFRVKSAAWMIFLCVAAGLLQAAIVRGVVEIAGWHTTGWTPREEWLFRIIFISLLYLTWSLTFFALKTRDAARIEHQRAAQAASEAQRMELQLLRAQLDPHFLFNSLNGIASEISTNPDAALEMVHELSDYLRYSLDHRHHVLAPLAAELDAVTAYLRIEQARFGDRMSASVEAEVETRQRMVPSFLLQPLIENAVKHGLQEERCELRIWAGCDGDMLTVTVSNPGRLPENLEVVEGVGLETLRRRLEFHYPGRALFELSQMDGIVTAELQLRGEPCSA